MSEPVELLEAILWTPSDGYYLLDRHLNRLLQSARHFGIPIVREEVEEALRTAVPGLPPEDHKVRLVVGAPGVPRVTAQPLSVIPRAAVQRVCLSSVAVRASDELLYHKTSRRSWLEREAAAHPGFDDVILCNERGEVTESCTANVVADIGGRKVTPPVSGGLLAGTFRGHLLAEGVIEERVIRADDLRAASALWLINSVRKWMPARLADS